MKISTIFFFSFGEIGGCEKYFNQFQQVTAKTLTSNLACVVMHIISMDICMMNSPNMRKLCV